MGEDVGRYGGCFGVSPGLLEEFGPERVRDTPLSESAFVGAGIGAALEVPIPYARRLEEAALPQTADIVAAAHRAVG